MISKKLFLAWLAGALLLLPLADCLAATMQDQQAMRCCSSMPCTPAQHGSACCKAMPSAPQKMLPVARASLQTPAVGSIDGARMLEVVRFASAPRVVFEAPQHSPPELYTLHASLLI
jgi:hypothetical protein